MIKNYCDMCGNEIEGTVWEMSINPKEVEVLFLTFNSKRDLCEICREKVRDFIAENSVQRCKIGWKDEENANEN